MHDKASEMNSSANVACNAKKLTIDFREIRPQLNVSKRPILQSNSGFLRKISSQNNSDSYGKLSLIQHKLIIGEPNDKFEQDADLVARAVLRDQCPDLDSEILGKQRKKISVLRIGENFKPFMHVSNRIEQQIPALVSGGQQLERPMRLFFEERFGADFSHVRMHNDGQSHEVAHFLNAKAFTIGNHIVLGKNQYFPDTLEGKSLIAHELAHVLQQKNNSPRIQRTPEEDWERANRDGQIELVSDSHIILWNFQVNSDQLKPAHQRALSTFLSGLDLSIIFLGPQSMHFDGYTSSSGSERLNLSLSQMRAFNAKSYALLTPELYQFDTRKFIDHGYSISNEPPNSTPENMARNRRVEVYISEYHPHVVEEPEEPSACIESWAFGAFDIAQIRIIPIGQESGLIIEKARGVLSHQTNSQSATWESKNCRYIGVGGRLDLYDALVLILSLILRRLGGKLARIQRSLGPAGGIFDDIYGRVRHILEDFGVELPEDLGEWIYEEIREYFETQYPIWTGAPTWNCRICESIPCISWDNWITGGRRYDGPGFEFDPVIGEFNEIIFNFNSELPVNLTYTIGIFMAPGGPEFIERKEEIRESVESIQQIFELTRGIRNILREIFENQDIEDIFEYIDAAEEILDAIAQVVDWCSEPDQTYDWIQVGGSSQRPPAGINCTRYAGGHHGF